MKKLSVGIVMGSDSDLPAMEAAAKVLDEFGVGYEVRVISAHRTPARAAAYATGAARRGLKVIIAGAGGAAHLAGVLAAHTVLPVIGVPMMTRAFKGVDSLLSTLQMPGGVPVATVAIGSAGAKNAGLLAVAVLATSSRGLAARLKKYRAKMARAVAKKDGAVRRRHGKKKKA
jgi:5-(carboxyamino)imidazole ribonucleotide mutase